MTGVAALRMYDLAEVREPMNELWSAVAMRLEDAPGELTWEGEQGVEWRDPSLVLGQTCGWPLVTDLRETVTVVGAFDYAIAGATGHPSYRSVIVTRSGDVNRLGKLAGSVAAVNGRDSLSGWVSLGVAADEWANECGASAPFFADIIETGSHRASVEAVHSGVADVASIDAVSYALFEQHLPALTSGLEILAHGPAVPTLPLITGACDPEPLRAALEAAVADPATAACRERLLINGFSRLDLSDYEHLSSLGSAAKRVF